MKSIKIVTSLLIAATLLASCVGDLDPRPLGDQAVTSVSLYNSPADYLQGLAKVYASFNLQGSTDDTDITTTLTGGDGGATVYTRQYWEWQELSTEEAVIAWPGNADLQTIHPQNWTPTGGYLTCLYTRILYTVTLCNEFIRVSNGNTDPEIQRYNAEARFLRALAYWHAMDLYGNVPFVTENDPIGAFYPTQIKRANLYTYVVKELLDIESKLGDAGFNYGHADKGALYMLQAKVYLNSNIYRTTPTNTALDSAVSALNKLFAGPYALADNYLKNFSADNNTSPEMIFPLTQDGTYSYTYGGMGFVVHAMLGGNMNAADFGVTSKWGGLRTTKALVNKFSDPSGATDKRARFYTNGQNLEINDIYNFNDGYAITKFSNKTFAGGPAPSGSPDFVDTDFPMFRLADAYLMYAEAVVRGATNGTMPEAVDMVNQVITRGYDGDDSHEVSTISLDFLLDERARELYWEGHRRTDLIRFGKFSGGAYVWPWKGNVAEGAATAADGHLDILPIPASDLAANSNLKQNPGYAE